MAVTNQQSTQVARGATTPPTKNPVTEDHGRVKRDQFDHAQSGAGDANSTVELVRLPSGRCRLLLHMSRVAHSAFGASRLLSIGHRAYTDSDGNAVAENLAAFATAQDVAAAGNFVPTGVVGGGESIELRSQDEIVVVAQVTGGTIPDAATLNGDFFYVCD